MPRRLTTDEWVMKARNVHGDQYDYSKVVYMAGNKKVVIGCYTHGDFEQSPSKHTGGQGCPKCVGKNRTVDEWIELFKNSHGSCYDYANVSEIKNNSQAIPIICSIHGGFTQSPNKHVAGQGCPKCAGRGLGTDEYISRFKLIHGDTYDYHKFTFLKAKLNSIATCKIHGDWLITPNNHLSGKGCPKCVGLGLSNAERISEFNKIHGGKYDYSLTQYTRSDQKITIICPTHGEFTQTAGNHRSGQGCQKCIGKVSQPEHDIANYLRDLGHFVLQSDRGLISPKELDIVIPSKRLAIEYCGLYWHGELRGKGKKYHLDKLKLANEVGYRLITVFEDEWLMNRPNVLSRISHIIGGVDNAVYARNTDIRRISVSEAREFLSSHHLQGYAGCSHRYGMYHNDELVAVMTFAVLSISNGHGSSSGKYELSRFATSVRVVGGASKLLTSFERDVEPREILTFADLRWGDGGVYLKLGFTHTHDSDPNYWYYRNSKIRKHRFGLRKNSDDDPSLTEWENRKLDGWDRIWDCGNRVYTKTY